MNRRKFAPAAAAFLLPASLALLAFATAGIWPFGQKTLLLADMNIEYIDYYAQINESLHTGGSLLRSWNMGMGLNMLGLIAFYAASPLVLIAAAVPLGWITEAVFAMTLIKIGLAGLAFFYWSGYRFPECDTMPRLAFAAAWGLCGYNIAYSSNLMWLDGVALLPLALLGVEKLLRENKCGMLLFSLAALFFTSYYIGYMAGGFSLLYFFALYFSAPKPRTALWGKLWRLAGCAALAAGCCAFLLLPAFLNLKSGQASLWEVPLNPELERPFVRIFSKLLPGAYDSLTDYGYPNIYCSVAAVFLTALFFASRKIPAREKIAAGALLGFLLLSFSCNMLDLAWHAFEEPTWFPARYSFAFSFVMLAAGLRAMAQKPERREVLLAVAAVALIILEIAINRYRHVNVWNAVAAAALLLCYAALLLIPSKRRLKAALALLLVCCECAGSAALVVRGMDEQFQYKSREGYRSFMGDFGAAVEAARSLDGGVYRTEILGQRGPNGGMALGYNGISHYSSTTDQRLNMFLKRLGYNDGTVNELRFTKNTPLANGLLGVRYVLSRDNPGVAYEKAAESGGVGIYRNTLDFPLAFFAESLPEAPESGGPFELQNALLPGLSAEEPFRPIKAEERLENVEKRQTDEYIEYVRLARGSPALVEFVVANPEKREVYAYFPVYNRRFSSCEIYVNGGLLQEDLGYRNNTVLTLGGEAEIRVSILLSGERIRLADMFFASLDLDAAGRAASEANGSAMQFTEFGDTFVAGTVSAPSDGFLITTFPLDRGWSVTVDEKKAGLKPFAGVFLAVELPEGEHEIEMRFMPPGFLAGCAVSLICLAVIAFWRAKKRNR